MVVRGNEQAILDVMNKKKSAKIKKKKQAHDEQVFLKQKAEYNLKMEEYDKVKFQNGQNIPMT